MKNNRIAPKDSVTLLVPAFNEEKSLSATVKGAESKLNALGIIWEIIIIDDGSSDNTGVIAQKLMREDNRIRVLSHKQNMGFGKTIKDGIQAAKMKHITGLPGDNDTSPNLIVDLLKNRKEADLIIAYMINPQDRSIVRRLFSYSYIILMNTIFGLKLGYYNSYFLCNTSLLKELKLVSNGFTIFAEAKVRLIKRGVSYKEIPFEHIRRKHGKSTAVSIKSIINSIFMLLVLINDIYFKNGK